jgi:hypothetical protein
LNQKNKKIRARAMKNTLYKINKLKLFLQNYSLEKISNLLTLGKNNITSDRILIIRTGGLGDFLFAIPAIVRLRKATEKKIYLLTDGIYDNDMYSVTPWAEMIKPLLVDSIHPIDNLFLLPVTELFKFNIFVRNISFF